MILNCITGSHWRWEEVLPASPRGHLTICCSSLSRVQLFSTPWTAARQDSLSFTVSRSLLRFMPIESLMPSNYLILCRPFSSYLQSVPASGSFPVSRLFPSGGQSFGASASASVLPMNIQGWFPLRLTGLISLGLSRVFSSATFQSINSLALIFLYGPTLISIHDYWRNHSFGYMNLCWQSDVSAF